MWIKLVFRWVDLPDVGGNVYNVTQPGAVDDYLLLRLAEENIIAIIDMCDGKYYEVVDTDQAQVEQINSNSSKIEKRCQIMGSRISTVREWQIAQSGTWWSPWYPVLCCYYCDKGPSSCSYSLGYSFTYGWSVTGSVTLAQIQASASYTLTRLSTKILLSQAIGIVEVDLHRNGINNKSTGLICRNVTEYSVRDVRRYYPGASITDLMYQ